MSPDHHPSHTLTVAVPSVPYGPKGVPVEKADAGYYQAAARNIRYAAEHGNSFAGSNLTETVAKLCEAAAEALEACMARKGSNV
jgi:hypothetical protein